MAFRNAIKWAIVYTLASVIWVFFEKLFGWRTTNIGVQAIYSNFYFLISLLIYFLAFRDQFKKEGSALRWNKGFGFGVKLTFIIVLFVPFYILGGLLGRNSLIVHGYDKDVLYSMAISSLVYIGIAFLFYVFIDHLSLMLLGFIFVFSFAVDTLYRYLKCRIYKII